ncbi:hypothetical protein Q9L58_008809, partial [Maublancomyces gigas]
LTRLGRDMLGLIESDSPRSKRLKSGIHSMVKFGERVHAEWDIEAFRHQDLRVQVAAKAKKNVRNRQRLTKTCLISYKDVVQLRMEREAKNQKSKGKGKAVFKGKMIAPPASGDDSSDSEVWEDEDEDIESILGQFGEGRADEMEDVIVVGGRK